MKIYIFFLKKILGMKSKNSFYVGDFVTAEKVEDGKTVLAHDDILMGLGNVFLTALGGIVHR